MTENKSDMNNVKLNIAFEFQIYFILRKIFGCTLHYL